MKLLWPVFKKAKEDHYKAVFIRDKLYINGSLYTGPTVQPTITHARHDTPTGQAETTRVQTSR